MKKITTIILAVMCAADTCAQDSYKEKTVFKNDDVEIRQIDERPSRPRICHRKWWPFEYKCE